LIRVEKKSSAKNGEKTQFSNKINFGLLPYFDADVRPIAFVSLAKRDRRSSAAKAFTDSCVVSSIFAERFSSRNRRHSRSAQRTQNSCCNVRQRLDSIGAFRGGAWNR
jgi:hypothetical protein